MPGANARAMEKARDLPADALIFDLEDAVAPAKKETARRQVIETLQKGGYGNRELVVRVNGLMTPWGEADVAEMATAGAHALLIPKVENKQIINGVEGRMLAAQAPDAMSIWCMIETPKRRHAGGRDRFRLARLGCAGDGDVRPRKGFAHVCTRRRGDRS